jgi:hypothetical protein
MIVIECYLHNKIKEEEVGAARLTYGKVYLENLSKESTWEVNG